MDRIGAYARCCVRDRVEEIVPTLLGDRVRDPGFLGRVTGRQNQENVQWTGKVKRKQSDTVKP